MPIYAKLREQIHRMDQPELINLLGKFPKNDKTAFNVDGFDEKDDRSVTLTPMQLACALYLKESDKFKKEEYLKSARIIAEWGANLDFSADKKFETPRFLATTSTDIKLQEAILPTTSPSKPRTNSASRSKKCAIL